MTKVNKLSGFTEVVAVAVLATLPVAVLVVFLYGLFGLLFPSPSCSEEYLGRVGSNPFCADCTANPFAPIANPYNANSINNEFGPYGNQYSPYSPKNPYAVDTPSVYGHADE